jgi:predicted O-methyltransferase YrrM
MISLLDKIFSELQVEDAYQNKYPLHSATAKNQCEFIADILIDIKPSFSLEIGLAYGISTIAIIEALGKIKQPFHHTVIDPYQIDWHNVGLHYINKTGYNHNVTVHEKFSDEVLPTLVNEGKRIQFAYIDSTKVFDILLTDIHFINKMLDVNGIIVFDDCRYPGIRKLIRYLAVHPSFKVYKGLDKDYYSFKRSIAINLYYFVLNNFPFKSYKSVGYKNHKLKTDKELGIDYRCVSFIKVKEDERNWNWYAAF